MLQRNRPLSCGLFSCVLLSQDCLHALTITLRQWSSQMQSEHEILMRFGSVFFPVQSLVGPIVTLGVVTLVDATGRLHPIPMDVCDSFEVSLAIRSTLGKLTHPTLSSDSMSSSSFYSNTTRPKLKFRDGIWSKDNMICALMTTSK